MKKIVLEVTEHELVLLGLATQQLSKNALSPNLRRDAAELVLKLESV